MSTLSALNDAIATRRNLALNPCVNMDTTLTIYDPFTSFAGSVQGYITSSQHNIQNLIEARDHQHDDLDRLSQSGAASSSHNQHEDDPGPTGAHNRA